MYPVLFKLFFIFNLFAFSEVTGNDVEITNINDCHPYNIQKVFEHFYTSINTKDKTLALAKYIFSSKPVDPDIVLKQLESLSEESKCLKDIIYTFGSLKNASANQWALSMLDSFPKPESGFLQGNFFWTGEYNECINVYAPAKAPNSTTGNFHGQYCTLSYNIPLFNASLPLKFALCLPDSCSPTDLEMESLLLLHEAGGFHVSDKSSLFGMPNITCSPLQRQLNAPAISVIALLSIFCAFALVGSSITAGKYFKKLLKEKRKSSLVINIYDKDISNQEDASNKCIESDDTCLINNDESNNKGFSKSLEAFLNCFCIFTNGAKLLNTDSSEGQLMCIHGIRFLSMSWVILGHAYLFNYGQIRNSGVLINLLDDFPFQIVLQGFYSVDSFFVLSGFLLSYLSMKEFSKSKGSINWPYFYIHRYIRLTPIYMICLGFSASVFLYLGSGPYWPLVDTDPNCSKTWWWNLLYINNFVNQKEQCMGWSWYLANDMQFFVISPIILITLWRWPKVGYSLLGLLLTACLVSNFIITYHFDLPVGLVGLGGDVLKKSGLQFMLKFMEFFDKIYIKPYTRIGPYLVGMLAGYILFKHKANNRPKLSLINLCIGWLVATAVTLTCVYGMYHREPSLIARSIYNAVQRSCFGAGLSWVIYVCLTNQSDVVNRILSYKLFVPLSRLTYSAYLIHPMILTGYYSNLKRPMEFSHPTQINLCIGWLVATAVTLTCVYGMYHREPSLIARSIYNAVQRSCFGAGLSWVIYVCLTNQSDVVNRILSYKLFVPLSRLTYSAYLIHPMILTGYYSNLKRPMEFSHPTLVILFLGFMVVTYALALPVSLILESPIVSMEKIIRSKFTKKQTGSAS